MRRVFTVFALVCTASLGMAQIEQSEMRIDQRSEKHNDKLQPLVKDEVELDETFTWWRDWSALMGGFESSSRFFTIFPDTFVKNVFLDNETNEPVTTYNNWCAIGNIFDPKDDAWSNPDLPGLRDWYGYTLDSIFFQYGYFRQTTDDVVDTLIVQIYKDNSMAQGFFGTQEDRFAIVPYDQAEGIGNEAFETITITIGVEDSMELNSEGRFSSRFYGVGLGNGEGIQIDAGDRVAATVVYKPGVEYAKTNVEEEMDTLFFDDDLIDFGQAPPKKKLNRFGILVSAQTPTRVALNSYNNGIFINRQNRYDDIPTFPAAFRDHFLPHAFGNGNTSFGYYPHIAYDIVANYNTGIEDAELQNGYALGQAYPNPATSQDEISLSFAVQEEERVQINILDLTGKVVKTITDANYAQGEHKLQFKANDLKPGVYIYRMTAGAYTQSSKFNIVR